MRPIFLILLSLTACAEIASAPRQSTLDTLVDVGEHKLHVVVHRGTRPLTILLEAGGGTDLGAAWSGLDAEIAAHTGATVVAYERAGFGRSEIGPTGLTIHDQLLQMGSMLEQLEVPRQRVVVGHSYGGLFAILQAAMSTDVVGLVLVDPMNPSFVEATGDFVASTVPEIPEPSSDRERAINRMKRTFGELVSEARGVVNSLSVPVGVVTAGEAWWGSAEVDRAWRRSHQGLAEGSDRRLWVAAGSDHDIPAEGPDVVLAALDFVLEKVR